MTVSKQHKMRFVNIFEPRSSTKDSRSEDNISLSSSSSRSLPRPNRYGPNNPHERMKVLMDPTGSGKYSNVSVWNCDHLEKHVLDNMDLDKITPFEEVSTTTTPLPPKLVGVLMKSPRLKLKSPSSLFSRFRRSKVDLVENNKKTSSDITASSSSSSPSKNKLEEKQKFETTPTQVQIIHTDDEEGKDDVVSHLKFRPINIIPPESPNDKLSEDGDDDDDGDDSSLNHNDGIYTINNLSSTTSSSSFTPLACMDKENCDGQKWNPLPPSPHQDIIINNNPHHVEHTTENNFETREIKKERIIENDDHVENRISDEHHEAESISPKISTTKIDSETVKCPTCNSIYEAKNITFTLSMTIGSQALLRVAAFVSAVVLATGVWIKRY
ncbi:hypothetical protein [Trichoplusia ni ascovirus 6b]|nr:hypothetical protein [Trichoplusia ni ascovirus 6b]